ncbi:TetR/AcrR family transcriptional regulator [Pseudonocardia sp. HH130630-07]|uniref:TetR/AcrR family transcriptional regulator n=1 Tax=Pseudonocardia sp. HH130630-07 TaxID=1690815 RepID=UPI000814E0C3|nr:TetR/AcrR family transcriptional regulator [Pseudonocardia sp. HH130630-07]ANY08008.1 TetR family transcriptional regulator [Pseudonocardia sp. HH130630-07]
MPEKSGSTPSRRRNRRGEGARLREDIVAGAVDLLEETGDEASVTLRAVARRVGITPPSIYRHFADPAAIMLAVVREAFEELVAVLRDAHAAAPDEPRARLTALCAAYVEFARTHPGRYRTMFGGVWMPDLEASSVTETDLHSLGRASLELLAEAVSGCAAAGISATTDPDADAVVLWLGLHGLAHQRLVTVSFPWPADVLERIVTSAARLTRG